MASRTDAMADPLGTVIEDTIYVAVGKEVREAKAILRWALQNSGGRRICILHIHQPSQFIPFLGAKVLATSLKEEIVKDHRGTERQKMLELIDEYILFCRQTGVRAQRLVIERDRIEDGIVELICQHAIKKLVMGATSEKNYKKKMADISSNKAKYVREKAPVFCRIQFICKGLLIFTRDAKADTETVPPSHLRSQSVHVRPNRDNNETRYDYPSRSHSIAERPNGDGRGKSFFDNSPPAGTGEILRHRSSFDVEMSSDESDVLSRSPSGCSTSFSKTTADITLSLWKEPHENGLQPNPPSPALSYSRSPAREFSSSLVPQSPLLVPSASTISRCSSGSLSVVGQEEMAHRKELEQALVREREELEKVKNKRDQLMEKLRDQETSFKTEIEKLQNEMNTLQMERDNALAEAERLKEKLADALTNQLPQFSEFSISELEEATQKFDESKKIGQGGYGNIYRGLLRQTEVAIKVLGSQNAHGISQLQMEVRVLSQLRHAHLVKLIGSCPEVFALIYEYLPGGTLEDRLTCKDNIPPFVGLVQPIFGDLLLGPIRVMWP